MSDVPTWRRSSFSGGGNDCVLVRGDLAALDDSKLPGFPLRGVRVPALVAWVTRRDRAAR